MIMPFVKRLKKWINEQAQGNQTSKKSKGCESKHMTAAGVINTNAAAAALNDRNETRSPNTAFFKNNGTQRRQRHKSMGDFDSTNVVAHDSTGETQCVQTAPNKVISNGFSDANGTHKSIGGKRKLFAIDQTTTKRSSSPFASHFQLQPVPVASTNGNHPPQHILMKTDCSKKKKKNVTPQRTEAGVNGDGPSHQDESEKECPISMQQKWLFNPPKLSQLLCKEPNIANWSNVRLNKDVIMHESLKLHRK